jgi:hypothetical protein
MPTEIINNHLREYLSPGECEIVDRVVSTIRKGLPDPGGNSFDITKYLSINLSLQEEISSIRVSLSFRKNSLNSEMKRKEYDLRTDLLEEGFKSASERDSMCHKDSRWSDLKAEVEGMDSILTYVTGLEWNLISGAKYFTR